MVIAEVTNKHMAGNESSSSDIIGESSPSHWNDVISDYARKTNGYHLPLTLPRTDISTLPADVVFWLVELRHNTGEASSQDFEVSIRREQDSSQQLPESNPEQIEETIHRYLEECVIKNQSEITSKSEQSDSDTDNDNSLLNFNLRKKSEELCFYENPQELYQDWEGLQIPRLSLCFTESLVSISNTNSEICMAGKPSLLWEVNPVYFNNANVKELEDHGGATSRWPRDNDDGLSCKKKEDDLVEVRFRRRNAGEEENVTCHVLNRENNYGADSSNSEPEEKKKSVLNLKCENILNNLDEMIKKFEDIQDNNLTGGNVEALLDLRDKDFEQMCETADNIIEETLKFHVDSVKDMKDSKVTAARIAKVYDRGSELSDDVFIDQELSHEQPRGQPPEQEGQGNYDINEIFDQGSGGKPPVPPRRKKRVEKNVHSSGPGNIDEESPVTHDVGTGSSNTQKIPDKASIVRGEMDGDGKKGVYTEDEYKRIDLKIHKNINCNAFVIDSNVFNKSQKTSDSVPNRCFTKLEIPTPVDCQIENTSSKPPATPDRKLSDIPEPDLRIHLTPTRTISSITFPPSDNPNQRTVSSTSSPDVIASSCPEHMPLVSKPLEIKDKPGTDAVVTRPKSTGISKLYSKSSSRNSNTYILPAPSADDSAQVERYTKLDEPSTSTSQRDESMERLRKGSNASDIGAWKQTLNCPSSYYHDDEMDPTSMESHEWFSSQDTDINGSLCSVSDTMSRSPSLPSINVVPCDSESESTTSTGKSAISNMLETLLRNKQSQNTPRAKSMLSVSSSLKIYSDDKNDPSLTENIWNEQTVLVQEGLLYRTKIVENGKKVKKNWIKSYVVLTKSCLLFLKDMKTFQGMKINADACRPDMSIDLQGAVIARDEKLSSRKNIFAVSSIHGLQVILQPSNTFLSDQWYNAIASAIRQLIGPIASPKPDDGSRPNVATIMSNSLDKVKSSPLLQRVRSVKRDGAASKKEESTEDLAKSVEERQTKTKARLKNFFIKRPTKEFLVKKGIYKDEPMFGRELGELVQDCVSAVPVFVTNCIQAIECKEENMKTDGLYRASGNLSQVQKIRLQVDQNCLSVLDDEEDVHVLTGVLKLFFRELKKPLIPFQMFHRAIAASTIQNQKERIRHFRELVNELATPNHDTLKFLLQHLLKVTENQEFNRMHIPNIAIVFGPTLMWPEQESLNMALDLMKQNLVIERLLVDYEDIFQ